MIEEFIWDIHENAIDVVCDSSVGMLCEEEIADYLTELYKEKLQLEKRLKEKDELLKKVLEVNANLTKQLLEN